MRKGSRHPEIPNLENPFLGDPFRDEDADVEDVEDTSDQNPYTLMEGYELKDASCMRVGEIEETVYDAVGDVLKDLVVNGHTVPADRIEVNAEEEHVRVPYGRETIGSAPALEDLSGEFDQRLRAHYEELG